MSADPATTPATKPQRSSGTALFLSSLVAVIPPVLVWLIFSGSWGIVIATNSLIVHFVTYLLVGLFVFTIYYHKPGHWIWKLPYSLLMATLLAFLVLFIIAMLIEPNLKMLDLVMLCTLIYGPSSSFAAWLLRPPRNT